MSLSTRLKIITYCAAVLLSMGCIQSSFAQISPPEKVFVFARAAGGRLNYRMFDGKSWAAWNTLDGIILGAPDVCSPNPGEVMIFARGQGGPSESELFFRTFEPTGTSSPWNSFRTKVGSDPGAACRSGGKVDVFVSGYGNSTAWWAWFENGAWANQYSIDPKPGSSEFRNPLPAIGGKVMGGAMLGSPDACSWGGKRLDLFVRGTDEYIWHKFRDDNGTWHEWTSLGGMKMTSDPSAATRAKGQMSIFARGENNQIWTTTYTLANDRWSPWLPIGGVHAGGPDATRTADNRIDVFSRGADNALWHTSVTYKGNIPDIKSVPAWESLGGKILSDPSAVGVNW
ncbi:MAG TPA: hypothetical protein VMZ26_15990 [Pyrinomonadaceae bacterium]|nr:hypothetical protein [Pyrinomonadaceae bacterium]